MPDLPPTYVAGFHNEEAVSKMRYNPLGSTGLLVSHLAYGGGCLNKEVYGEFDEEEAVKTIHEAIKNGVNYIDTAPWYGNRFSEEFLGKALKCIPRQAYYIATKVARYERNIAKMFDFSAEKTKSSFDLSLKLLGVTYVDIIQVHDVEFAPTQEQVLNETLPTVETFVKEGRARFVGISAYPLSIMKEVIEKSSVKISTVLSYCRDTLIDDSLREYMSFFQSKGVGVIEAASPAMGLLTSGGPREWHPASQQLRDFCAEMAKYCKDKEVELGHLAVNHALTQHGPATHLIGMQTRALLERNLNILLNGLSEKEKDVLSELESKYLTRVPEKHWEGRELETYWAQMKTLN
ncbi:hypothetical protein R5R35_002648 [Gryllus longicercus]|uniref:NADP-dependent oxidoreductase domain-containing protein n=1 Tax=Gryllus longicercus TaxID=2509291 RepID=A0AAN9ZFK8_9ORTH